MRVRVLTLLIPLVLVFFAGTAAAGGGAEAAARGFGDSLKEMLKDPSTWGALASTIPALMASNQNNQQTDELKRIQAITENRLRRTDPLHQAVTQLAFSRLPMNSRQGLSIPNLPLAG